MSTRISRILTWTVCLLAVTACMPSSITVLPDPTDDAELVSAGNGVLVLQVADTTPFGIGLPINQLTLAPKDVNVDDEGKFPRILAAEDVSGDSSKIFYAVLPADQYSINSLRAYYQFGESWFSQFYPADIELGTFTVEPGKVTDLGILAVFVRRDGEDYRFETVRADGDSRALAALVDSVPGLAARIENQDAPLTWHSDAMDSDRRNDYINAVNRQIVYSDPYVNDDTGEVRFPSRLGVIVQRTEDGSWVLDAVPQDVELRRISRVGDSDVVITEFGDLLARANNETEWVKLETPAADGELMLIGEHAAFGVFAVVQHESAASIWSAAELGGGWTQQASIERTLGFLESLNRGLLLSDSSLAGANYVASGDYLYLVLGKDVHRYDLRTRQQQELKTPDPQSIQIRNGVITISSKGTFRGSRASFDNGESWQRYTGRFLDDRVEREEQPRRQSQRYRREQRSVRLLGHPIFTDRMHGFAIHEALKKDQDPFLVQTDDGAETWHARTRTALPEGCARLITVTEGELLLSCFLSGEFYRSLDNGESWQLDRDVSET